MNEVPDYAISICCKAHLGWCEENLLEIAQDLRVRWPNEKLKEVYEKIADLHWESALIAVFKTYKLFGEEIVRKEEPKVISKIDQVISEELVS